MSAQRIGNRYQLETRLGEGGMGTVYRGVDTHTNEIVAVKHLKPELVTSEPQIVARFTREAEALRQLNHPHIVKALATLEDDNQHYIILEYVGGGSLADTLRSENKLPISRVLEIAIDLSDALIRAHRLNIIHRDLKPANVLLADDGTPRLTDFGIAFMRGRERVTETQSIVGTLDYLSPEAFQEPEVDARSDIWAFGVLLFELLAGKRPFDRATMSQTMMAILTEAPADLEVLCPACPVALVDLIYRMLEKDKNQRIPSARQVSVELENIQQGRATSSAREVKISDVPPPTPSPVTKHNLPIQTTPFVGREDEIAHITQLLEKSHLITILAPGGMGKTRLALEVGAQYVSLASESFPNGVYFVALAPLTSSDFIVSAIAEAFNFQFYPGSEPRQQLLDFLREKNLLLIMDNFEHVLAGTSIVSDILANAPHVSIIVTSRERLNLSGETLVALSGMSFPAWKNTADAMDYAAVKLFMQGARRVRPDFELVGDELKHLAHICRLVDGLPLGIVLASSWLEMLSLSEIVDEIGKSIDFLETEMRDIPERQRSIRAVFDYSWNLMTPNEQDGFKKLSVFRGGFTREAAQTVAGASLKTLMSLVNKSLVRRDVVSGRYEVHELLRQYADAHLNENTAQYEAAHEVHRDYFTTFMQQRELDMKGRRQKAGLDETESDFENIRAAWQGALQHRRYPVIDEMMEAVKLFCEMRSRYQDRQEFFGKARQQLAPQSEETPHPVWYRIVVRCVGFLEHRDDETALFSQCLEAAEARGDRSEIAYCLFALGDIQLTLRNYVEALQYFQRSLDVYREIGDQYYVALLLNRSALCYSSLRQQGMYVQIANESLHLARTIGDKITTGWALHSLGSAAGIMGDIPEYRRCFEEANLIWREMENLAGIATSNNNIALASLFQGDIETAESKIEEALEISIDRNYLQGKGTALVILGILNCITGDYARAKQVLEEGAPLVAVHPQWKPMSDIGFSALACGTGDFETVKRYLPSGLRSGILSIVPVLNAAIMMGEEARYERAAELIGFAFHAGGAPQAWYDKWVQLVRIRKQIQDVLGVEAASAAYERGKAFDFNTVVAELLAEL